MFVPGCIHHFKLDLIDNVNHMRTSGTEPLLVIFRQNIERSLRCMHHFKSDLINNVHHMRTTGTEPSSLS